VAADQHRARCRMPTSSPRLPTDTWRRGGGSLQKDQKLSSVFPGIRADRS
jgi:hypothetical protein